jgi:tRNA dimethylallyltransferase
LNAGEPTTLPPILVIAGATATGKTGLAIRVATALRAEGLAAEIISADSRQVYRGLDIGTAKASLEERARVPHHGLDLVDPDEPFTVADFAAHARTALASIGARGGIGLLAGGTGLYLRAVARGIDTDALPTDRVLRAELEAELARSGVEPLVARLISVAPTLAAETDLRNPRRVVRALEIAGRRGDGRRPEPRGYPAPAAWLGLRVDPAEHRRRIDHRAREQFNAGLIEEARRLRERFDPGLPAFSAIGYREAWSVLDLQATLEEAIDEDVRRNMAFGRRQRTWFRSEPDIIWMDAVRDDGLERALDAARILMATPSASR